MVILFVVYRESDSTNQRVFLNYLSALDWIDSFEGVEKEDLFIDWVPCYAFTVKEK